MKLYKVKPFPTLEGKPAGPDEDEYLDFVPGELVVIRAEFDGVVLADRLSDGLVQELDKTSLELIGKGLKLIGETA